MNNEGAQYPAVKYVARNLFEQRSPPGRSTRAISVTALPVRYVTPMKATPRQFHHRFVNIKGGHLFGAQPIQDHLSAHTAPAPDHRSTRQSAIGEPPKPRRFPVVLKGGAHRVVHHGSFDGIEIIHSSLPEADDRRCFVDARTRRAGAVRPNGLVRCSETRLRRQRSPGRR